jgi:hypothetical protein
MKSSADTHKKTKSERYVALAAASGTGVNRHIPSLFSVTPD